MLESLDVRARDVFEQVIDLPRPERARRIEAACDGDRALCQRVETLLAAAEREDSFLSDPAFDHEDLRARFTGVEQPGDRIGPYLLLELIGEGGFGSVFRAEQTAPVRRQVALKIIKAGMDTKQVIARFEAERQALALMDHPNIARVLEAGATAAGRPYFVMELIGGEPVTRYCDRERLSVAQRLQLFCDICSAIQHAHQKGVIHRDLKPSNILVTSMDGAPHAKVIDFGIAKATATHLTGQTITGLHQLIGTPEYMSPEQADGSADVDTRSDIYSLGVLLYELLTGTTPFERARLADSGPDGIRRIIRDEEPARPSARLQRQSSLDAGLRTPAPEDGARPGGAASSAIEVAGRRQTAPALLVRTLRRDLDWIVLKCLEKERARRYETASALSDDIRRYLSNQPVLATPPRAGYRLRKFVRRNRGVALAATTITASLLTAAGVSIAFGMSEARQRAAAEQVRDELQDVADFQNAYLAGIDAQTMGARLRADLIAQVRAAAARAKQSPQEIDERVRELEELLAGSDFTGLALEALNENILQPGLDAAQRQFADQPLIRARLLQTLASTLSAKGLFDAATLPQTEALAIRQEELGPEHPETLSSLAALGALLRAQGKLSEAEQPIRAALQAQQRILGEDHPATLDSWNNLARLQLDQGKLAEAESAYRALVEHRRRVLGPEHRDTVVSIGKLSSVLIEAGKPQEAEQYSREALAIRRRISGDTHPETLIAIGNMGSALRAQGKLAEAAALYTESVEKSRLVLGNEHPDTLTRIANLGGILVAQGELDKAEPYVREALEKRRRLLGEAHINTLRSINSLVSLLWTQGKVAEAEEYLFQALEVSRRALPEDHPDTLTALNNVGVILRARGDVAAAERYFRESLEKSRARLGEEHGDTLISATNLGDALVALDRAPEALALLAPIEPAVRRAFTADNVDQLGRLLRALGRARTGLGEFAAAEADLSEAHAILMSAGGVRPRDRTELLSALAALYTAWDAAEPGQGYAGKAAEWQQKLEAHKAAAAETP